MLSLLRQKESKFAKAIRQRYQTLQFGQMNMWEALSLINFEIPMRVSNEMFVTILTVHCDQNNSYEITRNCLQVRKINEIRNSIFGLSYGKPSSALRSKFWVFNQVEYLMISKYFWENLVK